ncbi:hypothetical protein LOD99_2467 [Oopsacas minuta]|uniref:Uncharacterized protein n=1 Tax=Oopsacas minuta TaxID=111878 RepID=A0AAV7K2L5_9METZ|nr:hypothetical protein LOD99_2467 [Oopsacas minuta]
MELKLISIVALLLFILSLQCQLSLGEESDSVGAAVPERDVRQTIYYYYYDYNSNSYYTNYYYTSYYYPAAYIIGGIICCCVFCSPCIITAIVVCCCFMIPGCPLGNRNSNQVVTTTTVNAGGNPGYPEKTAPTAYPQTGYPPQAGYPQPVQTYPQYPATQGYYPDTAPAQAYPPQTEPVKSADGYNYPPNPGYNPYPTDQAPPTYNAAQEQPQTHGIGFQS